MTVLREFWSLLLAAILLMVLMLTSGCATSQGPTLEILMRRSYWYGCAKKFDNVAETAIWIDCQEKAKYFDLEDIPEYSDDLELIRRKPPRESPR